MTKEKGVGSKSSPLNVSSSETRSVQVLVFGNTVVPDNPIEFLWRSKGTHYRF